MPPTEPHHVATPRRLGALLLCGALAAPAALSGCGGAQAPTSSGAGADPEAALADAERALAVALGEPLAAQPGAQPSPSPAYGGADAQRAPQPQPTAQPVAPSAPPEPEQASAEPVDRCESACDAGAAIARAVERICALDVPEGARCERARARLVDARARLSERCPSCALP